MLFPKQLSTILLTLVLGLSLGLSGCGGSSSNDSTSTPTTSVGTGGGGAGGGDAGGGDAGGGDAGGGDAGGGDAGGDAGFSGVEGPLDPVQDGLSSVVGDQVAAALPEPLSSTVACADEAIQALVDAPDALLLAFAALPGGADPAEAFNGAAGDITASLQVFAAKLQSSLMILAGQPTLCSTGTVGGNPFTGTPLEPVGVPLAALIGALQSAGDGGSGGDPNLSVVVATITPLLDQLGAGFDMVPPEVADAPVVGGVISTVEVLIADLSTLLTDAGDYNPVATEASLEALLNNALGNLLLNVLPVADIDAASGQDFSTQIQDGIDTLTAAFGDGLGMVITPAFNDGLDGALSPILDPVEGLLSALLASGDTGNPLDGILDVLAGGGASPLDSLLAILLAGADGTPLAALAGEFPDGGTGTPLDDVLVLIDPANPAELDAILGELLSALDDTPLSGGGALGGLLDGVGGILGL